MPPGISVRFQPDDPLPAASDIYKSLLLLAHGIVVVDSIGDIVAIRLLEADSLDSDDHRRAPASI